MRDEMRVRILRDQLADIRHMLAKSQPRLVVNLDGSFEFVDVLSAYPHVAAFVAHVDAMVKLEDTMDTARTIAAAREAYQTPHGDNDIEIDDDAAFSPSDEGTWVGGWVWVENFKRVAAAAIETEESV